MGISYDVNYLCCREYEEFTILYDLKNRQILKLENVAADIWNYIYNHQLTNVNEIVEYIVSEYDCLKEDIEGDVVDFVDELYIDGVISLDGQYYFREENSPITEIENATEDIEGKIIEELQNKNILYSVTFELTYACNERCVHCYAHNPKNVYKTATTGVQQYKKIIDELLDLKCMHLAFTGGDPFIYRDFLELFTYARQKGFVCDIFTNGIYLAEHEDTLMKIIKMNPRAFYISLYGCSAGTHDSVTGVAGSFEKTIKIVRILKSYNIPVVFNVMMLSVNYCELEGIIKLAGEVGAEYRVSMSLIYTNEGDSKPMKFFVNNKKTIKQILQIIQGKEFTIDRKYNEKNSGPMCGAGLSSLSIAPDGRVYPCVSLKNQLGSVQEESISEIWNGIMRNDFVKKLSEVSVSECATCQYLEECLHCIGISQAERGDIFVCNTCDRIIAECRHELNTSDTVG